MSWSISFIGKPENVAKALDEQSTKMDGQSKIEYDDALPSMKFLVEQNFGNGPQQLIKIIANGHGYAVGVEQQNRYLACTIESVYGVLV